MLSLLPPAIIIFLTLSGAASIFPNSTISRTSGSGSITSSFLTATSSFSTTYSWQKSCLYYPNPGYGDCNRPGDPLHEVYGNPYDTSMSPSNIIPPNPSLATYCSLAWSSAESVFLSTAIITSTTYPGVTNIGQEDNPLSRYFLQVVLPPFVSEIFEISIAFQPGSRPALPYPQFSISIANFRCFQQPSAMGV
jgi:hypothetical protein